MIPAAAAILLMLPRLAWPLFGFLDDAGTLKYSRELTESVSSLMGAFTAIGDTGRFIPTYFLYYAFVYWIHGADPLVFYLANTLALIVAAALIARFMQFRGASFLQASAAGTLFVLSGPVLESFYTNSQEGPPQVVLLGLSLLLLETYSSAPSSRRRALTAVALFLSFFAANCTMETSVAMFAVALAWSMSAHLKIHGANDGLTADATRMMAATSLLAVVAWYLLRAGMLHLSLSGGTYTSGYRIGLGPMLVTGAGWLLLLFRDFLYLIPLVVTVLSVLVRGKQSQTRLIVDALTWIGAWVAIYLPWQSALEYYMLPCAIGFAMLGGVVFGQVWDLSRGRRRMAYRMALVTSAVLLFLTCVNNWTNGRYQIAMDKSNMALIDYLATLPRNSKVLVNLQAPNEFEYEIGLHLVELKKRADLVVDYFRLQTPSAKNSLTTQYLVNPVVKNEVHPSVRYAMDEAGTTPWNRAATDFIGRPRLPTFDVKNRVRLADVGFHRLLCVVLGSRGFLCQVPRPFIDRRLLTYGWEVYRLDRRVEDVAQPAVFLPDGTWLLQAASGGVRRIRFGEPGDYPLSGEWERRGLSGVGVYRPADKTWRLDVDLDGSTDITFRWSEMEPDDVPLAGDWYGQGRAGPGYFRPRDASWHFLRDFRDEQGGLVLQFGTPSDIPLTGDWDGDGRTTIGVYRKASGEVTYLNAIVRGATPASFVGFPDSTPVVGQWSGNGADSVTFVADDVWRPRLVNSPETPSNPAASFHFDSRQGRPLSGRWR